MLRHYALLACCLVVQTACSSSNTAGSKGPRGDGGAENGGEVSFANGGSGEVAGAGTQAGTAGVAGAASAPVAFGPIGPECDVARPCAEGLTCYPAGGDAFGDFSPAGGFCSKVCASDSECIAIDVNARCAELYVGATPKVCFPTCQLGDNTACGGRADLACWPMGDVASTSSRLCLPTCNYDDQCPDGTVCDGFYNLCATVAPAGGLPLGSACDADSATNNCAEGFCIGFEGGGACTAYCRRGTFPQCGGGGDRSTCGWVFPGDEAAGNADIGMCADTCRCNRDCATGLHCVAHPDRQGLASPGLCSAGSLGGIASCD